MINLTIEEAKRLALASQGLTGNIFENNPLKVIEQLTYVQIDTISVIARAHHHTQWIRNLAYQEENLNRLLEKEKSIFEYWSHAASYLPMQAYRFSLFRKKAYADGKNHWFTQDEQLKQYVLERIKAEGELQSKDFQNPNKSRGWYDWKPAKKALEQLFMEGKLMVARRRGFQKVYDLTERVLPSNVDTSLPTPQEYFEHLIFNAIRAHGIVHESEIGYLRNKKLKDSLHQELKKLVKEKKLLTAKIKGWDNQVFFTTKSKLAELEKINQEDYVHFLSPFDNTIIQRNRVKRFFDFDYQIECYVPAAKRKYGYFTLPVLFNNQFVGRFDPKADRKNKIFYIKSIHFEDNFQANELFNELFAQKLKAFARFNQCEEIVIEKAPKGWKKGLYTNFLN